MVAMPQPTTTAPNRQYPITRGIMLIRIPNPGDSPPTGYATVCRPDDGADADGAVKAEPASVGAVGAEPASVGAVRAELADGVGRRDPDPNRRADPRDGHPDGAGSPARPGRGEGATAPDLWLRQAEAEANPWAPADPREV